MSSSTRVRWNRRATAASFTICVLMCLLWARSFRVGDYVTHQSAGVCREFSSELGGLHYSRMAGSASDAWSYSAIIAPSGYVPARAPNAPWSWFQWSTAASSAEINIPFWPLVVAFLAPTLLWIGRFGWPRWGSLAAAFVLGLWPFELAIIFPGVPVGAAVPVVAVSAIMAMAILFVRDRKTFVIQSRTRPWPWQVRKLQRYRRVERGLCVGCGYDLRGSSDRCPECGQVF